MASSVCRFSLLSSRHGRPSPGTAISFAAASLGVLTALQNVVSLAPAVAMRPAAPLRFRRSWIEALLSAKVLSPRRIMMLRNIAGRPLRSCADHRRHCLRRADGGARACSGATPSTT